MIAALILAAAVAAAPDPARTSAAERARLEREWRPHAADAAFQTEGLKLLEQVRQDPRFGGFIFRSSPEPHAVVMFTGDAEERLRRYTRDPRYKAQSVGLTLAELERMKDATSAQLRRAGFHCWTVDGDEEHNAVTVTMPDPSQLERAIAAGRVKAPAKFRLLKRGCPQLRRGRLSGGSAARAR